MTVTIARWRQMLVATFLVALLAAAMFSTLRAQETTPPAASEPAPAAGEDEDAKAEEPPADEENVSADNSLSFPVDI